LPDVGGGDEFISRGEATLPMVGVIIFGLVRFGFYQKSKHTGFFFKNQNQFKPTGSGLTRFFDLDRFFSG